MNSELYYIAFGDSAAYTLKEAIYEGLEKHRIICFREDFTQGPLEVDYSSTFILNRIEYWKTLSPVLYNLADIGAINKSTLAEFAEIGSKSKILLWTGHSAYDQLASYWIANYAIKAKLRVFEIKIDAINLAVLSPKSLSNLLDSMVEIHPLQTSIQHLVWTKLCKESGAHKYRILEGETIKTVESTYYEAEIINLLDYEPTLAMDVIASILNMDNLQVSDVTIEYLIRKLIVEDKVLYEGELNTMTDYKIYKPKP